VILQAYQFNLVHRKSECLHPADALSRLHCEAEIHDVYNDEVFEELPVSVDDVASETAKDPLLSKVLEYTRLSWPYKIENPDLQYYQKLQTQLASGKGCLLFNNSVVIPPSLRAKVLRLLHLAHPGTVRTKALARNKVWWPGLSQDIET